MAMAGQDELKRYSLKGYHGSLELLLPADKEVPADLVEGRLSQIGFVPPDHIPAYRCGVCSTNFELSPVVEVYIRAERGIVGHTEVIFKCRGCHKPFYSGGFISPEGIDPKYIMLDETGDYKAPTPETIEMVLAKALALAESGNGCLEGNGLSDAQISIASHLAGKISYPIDPARIDTIRQTHRTAYIKKAQEGLPALVNDILRQSHGFSLFDDDCGITAFEGTGVNEDFHRLRDILPVVIIPDGLKRNIYRILAAYRDMFGEKIRGLEEKKKGIEQDIASATEGMTSADDSVKEFAKMVQLPPEVVAEAIEHPLSTFPGDEVPEEEGANVPF
ncbi:hypothetical protein HZB90_01605 [archaeon]|nr:hypothetical protein [archaeon]